MATYSGELRRGLPRVAGGDPWPAGWSSQDIVLGVTDTAMGAGVDFVQDSEPPASRSTEPAPAAAAAPEAEHVGPAAPTAPAIPDTGVVLRRGLPRTPDGEPWPPAGTIAAAPATSIEDIPATQAVPSADPVARHAANPAEAEDAVTVVEAQQVSAQGSEFVASETPLRRGLPRAPGGEPWPAAGFAPIAQAATPETAPGPVAETTAVEHTDTVAAEPVVQAEPVAQAPVSAPATPSAAKPKREPVMVRGRALAHWVRLGVLGIAGAIAAAGIIVLAARGVTTLPGVPEWLERYPGEYDLPDSAVPGFPWWVRWSHFLNIFLMVLIIRSGLLVRQQQQPPAFWTPKRGGKKISINLWLHTSLDVLWLVNGVIFVVLLFVSGHWKRVVPTSWEVFPNALSALLQYLTLDWPPEHGWVNYNSLQQIMYFLVIFVAAPLAAITGVRMSEWWPKDAERLNRFCPAPLARALHFPTMLFFVQFILVHVFLVFSTGALRNLNHMFAGTDVVNWTGFWLFALAIFLTAAGWIAARPLVLAPVAKLFGRVSNR